MVDDLDKSTEIVKAAAELAKSVPIYSDAVQPAAKKIGEALEVVTSAVIIALAPVRVLVWGYDQVEAFLVEKVAEKLRHIPKERIQTPPPVIAGPLVNHIRFLAQEDKLREMFANLLATSMDANTVKSAHPSFVEILKNITSDEAKILDCLSGKAVVPVIDLLAYRPDGGGYAKIVENYTHIHHEVQLMHVSELKSYINNLCRLGLYQNSSTEYITNAGYYEPLENDPELDVYKQQIKGMGRNISFVRRVLTPTAFGDLFIKACVKR